MAASTPTATLSANLLGSSVTWNGVGYALGGAGLNDTVSAQGQAISLPVGMYQTLSFLAAGVNGNQPDQTFTVTYTDGTTQTFTQSISDWFTPQGYTGESTAVTMPYRNTSSGGQDDRSFNLYGYQFTLDSSKSVQSISLPSDGNVEIVGMNLTPAADGATVSVTGQAVSGVVASFTDADPNGQPGLYRAVINWGDGSPLDNNAVITANGSGGFDVSGGHTYNADGNYTIQVTVQDGDPTTGTATNTAFISGPSNGTGTLTVNAFNNNTPATITFINALGQQQTEDTLLTQINLTYNADTSNSITYNGFCIDLNHTVTEGQTYAVNAQANLASLPGGSRIAYISQQYDTQDLSSDPVTAAAAQAAIWSLLTMPAAQSFQLNSDGTTYSPYDANGVQGSLSINLNGNAQTAAIVAKVNAILAASLNATTQDDYFATLGGGQSMSVPSSLVDNLASGAQVRTFNPINSDSQSQVGNNQLPACLEPESKPQRHVLVQLQYQRPEHHRGPGLQLQPGRCEARGAGDDPDRDRRPGADLRHRPAHLQRRYPGTGDFRPWRHRPRQTDYPRRPGGRCHPPDRALRLEPATDHQLPRRFGHGQHHPDRLGLGGGPG